MYHLIKKDVLMQKKNMKFSLLIMLFFAYTLATFDTGGLVISVLAISYLLVLGASALEDHNNSDAMLVSLPIKKERIVLAKYVSVYVFAAYALMMNAIIALVVDLLNVPNYGYPITADAIFGAFVAVSLLFSVTFPLIFKLGYLKSKIANYAVFFTLIFGGTAIASRLSGKLDMQAFAALSEFEFKLLVAIPVIAIVVLSLMLSLRFYKNREF